MNFSPVDIGYFLEVVRQRNLGKAAQACGVTQPSISKALRRLEDATGAPLVERGAHGARLTSHGSLFTEVAQRFLQQHEDMVRVATDLRARHACLLRMGLANLAQDSFVLDEVATLLRARPGLRLQMVIGLSDMLNDQVERGELDAAIVPVYPTSAMSCVRCVLAQDTMVPVASVRHPLADLGAPPLHALARYPWALPPDGRASRRMVMDAFEHAEAPRPRIALEIDFTSEATIGLIHRTEMLGLVPAAVLQHWGHLIMPLDVPALVFERKLVMLTRPRASLPEPLATLRQMLVARRGQSIPLEN